MLRIIQDVNYAVIKHHTIMTGDCNVGPDPIRTSMQSKSPKHAPGNNR